MCNQVLIETLYKELEFLRNKGLKIDEWFFKIIPTILIPFFILIGYSIIKAEYRIAICAIPPLSGIGILVIANLHNHYSYINSYSKYLTARINQLVGEDELQEYKYAQIYFTRYGSIVYLSFFIGIFILVLINALLLPMVIKLIDEYYLECKNAYRFYELLSNHYLRLVLLYWTIPASICAWIYNLISTRKKEKELVTKIKSLKNF